MDDFNTSLPDETLVTPAAGLVSDEGEDQQLAQATVAGLTLEERLNGVLGVVWADLANRSGDAGFIDLLTQVYAANSVDGGAFSLAAGDLASRLASGDQLGLRFELETGAEMGGAAGAYAVVGDDGVPTIYINGDWLASASNDLLQRVLLEEIGHSFDTELNGSTDTAGDEGELFANLFTGTELSAEQRATISGENDQALLTIDGQNVLVEEAADRTAPTLSSSSPADNATAVAVGSDIVLNFDEPVKAGIGNITISNGTDTFTIAIDSSQVSISGSKVTINPTNNLLPNSTYYVQIEAGAFTDVQGNAFAGISNTTTLNFSTVTLNAAPTDLSLSVTAINDNVDPSQGDLSTGASTNDTTPTIKGAISGSLAAGDSIEVFRDGTSIGNATVSGSTWQITDNLSQSGDGTYAYTAQVRSQEGTSALSSAFALTLDTVAPGGSIELNTIAADGIVNIAEAGGTVNVSGLVDSSDAKAGDQVRLKVNGNTYTASLKADRTFAVDVAGSDLAAGSAIEATVDLKDGANNAKTLSTSKGYSKDLSAPTGTVTIATLASDGVINIAENDSGNGTITITGRINAPESSTIQAGDLVKIFIAEGVNSNGETTGQKDPYNATVLQDANGFFYSYDLDASQLSGNAFIEVQVPSLKDAAGNTGSASAVASYSFDLSAPTALILTPPANSANPADTITNNNSFTVAGVEEGALWQYSTDGGSSWTDGSGTSFTVPDDTYADDKIIVQQIDAAGNPSSETVYNNPLVVDTQINVPTFGVFDDNDKQLASGEVTRDTKPLILGSAEAGSSVVLKDGEAILATATADAEGLFEFNPEVLAALEAGEHSFTVAATDVAGNIATSSPLAFTVTSNQAAEIGDLNPLEATVEEDTNFDAGGYLSTTGQLSITDADAGEAAFIATTSAQAAEGVRNWGLLEIDAQGNYTYKLYNDLIDGIDDNGTADNPDDDSVRLLGAGDVHVDSFIVTSIDGTTKQLDFSVFGKDDTSSGALIDGYLAGAIVYSDWNGNRELDWNDKQVSTTKSFTGTTSIAGFITLTGKAKSAEADTAVVVTGLAGSSTTVSADGSWSWQSSVSLARGASYSFTLTTIQRTINEKWDAGEGEAWTTTDEAGNFSFTFPKPPTGTGYIDNPALVSIGGIDTTTGLEFEGSMTAPSGSTAISPLTTIVQAYLEAQGDTNGSYANAIDAAMEAVATSLGLPTDIDLTNYDPIEAFNNGTPEEQEAALAVQQAAAQVANFLAIAESTGIDSGLVAASLAATIASDSSAGSVDLADSNFLLLTLQDAATELSGEAAEAVFATLEVAGEVLLENLAALNSQVAEASDLNSVFSTQQTAQGDLATLIENVSGTEPAWFALDAVDLPENLAVNATVATVQVLKADGPVSYALQDAIGNAYSGPFVINSATGKISATESFNYEALNGQSAYTFKVVATGDGLTLAPFDFTVNIKDVNDSATADTDKPISISGDSFVAIDFRDKSASGSTLSATLDGLITDQEGFADTNEDQRPDAITWAWTRNGQIIGGADSSTYNLTLADIGHTISAVASFTDANGNREVITTTDAKLVDTNANTVSIAFAALFAATPEGSLSSVDQANQYSLDRQISGTDFRINQYDLDGDRLFSNNGKFDTDIQPSANGNDVSVYVTYFTDGEDANGHPIQIENRLDGVISRQDKDARNQVQSYILYAYDPSGKFAGSFVLALNQDKYATDIGIGNFFRTSSDLKLETTLNDPGQELFALQLIGNEPPDANDDSISVAEDSTETELNLLLNDTDADSNPLTIDTIAGVILTPGTAQTIAVPNGTVNVSDAGIITFTPDANYNGDVSFQYTISDGNDGTDTATVYITITGTNDAAEITGDTTGDVTEDAQVLTTSGILSVSDVDTGEGSFVSTSDLEGTYGSFTFDLDTGEWEYTLANDSDAVQELPDGQEVTDTLTVTTDDGTTETITITITGTNDQPVIDSITTTGDLTEEDGDASLSDSGTLSFSDLDATDVITVDGTYNDDISWSDGTLADQLSSEEIQALIDGFVASNTGWTYNSSVDLDFLAAGETITFSYDVVATDDSGADNDASAAQTVTITITGTNDQPVIDSITTTGDLTEEDGDASLSDSGTLSFSDLDATDVITVDGTYNDDISWSDGTLADQLSSEEIQALIDGFVASNTGWTYNSSVDLDFLAAGETITFSYDVVATDDSGADNDASAAQTVTITITGTNDQPVISTQDGDRAAQSFTETATAAGVASPGHSTSGTLTVRDIDITDEVDISIKSVEFSGTGNTWNPLSKQAALAMFSLTAGSSQNEAESDALNNLAWAFNSGTFGFDYLAAGETQVITYTLEGKDSAAGTDTQTVVITVTGTQDIAVISGTSSGVVTEKGGFLNNSYEEPYTGITGLTNPPTGNYSLISGKLDVVDLDRDQAFFAAKTETTKYGTFRIGSDGNWSYQLDDNSAVTELLGKGDIKTETFQAFSKDGTASQTVTVDIRGADDAARVLVSSANNTLHYSDRIDKLEFTINDPDGPATAIKTSWDFQEWVDANKNGQVESNEWVSRGTVANSSPSEAIVSLDAGTYGEPKNLRFAPSVINNNSLRYTLMGTADLAVGSYRVVGNFTDADNLTTSASSQINITAEDLKLNWKGSAWVGAGVKTMTDAVSGSVFFASQLNEIDLQPGGLTQLAQRVQSGIYPTDDLTTTYNEAGSPTDFYINFRDKNTNTIVGSTLAAGDYYVFNGVTTAYTPGTFTLPTGAKTFNVSAAAAKKVTLAISGNADGNGRVTGYMEQAVSLASSETSKDFLIATEVGGKFYQRSNTLDDTVVTFAKTAMAVAGGTGNIDLKQGTAGQFLTIGSGANAKTVLAGGEEAITFSSMFNVQSNKAGSNLKGKLLLNISSEYDLLTGMKHNDGAHSYVFTTNAWQTFGMGSTSSGGVVSYANANLIGKANGVDTTTGQSLGGNLNVQVNLRDWDVGTDPTTGTYTFNNVAYQSKNGGSAALATSYSNQTDQISISLIDATKGNSLFQTNGFWNMDTTSTVVDTLNPDFTRANVAMSL